MSDRRLSTPRLELRPLASRDLGAVHRLWTDPDVRRFLFDDREIGLDEVRQLLDESDANFRERGYGLWLGFEPASDRIAVFAGLLRSEPPPSLVYGVSPPCRNRGLATEAAARVLRHGFEALGLPRIVADVDEPNLPSVRVLEKLGMTCVRRAVVSDRPLLYFEAAPPLPAGR
jgi:RimJ/RimL family protein N-acetyltransferase